jgi:KDO2-lipid IV(A) lauroyltransferase
MYSVQKDRALSERLLQGRRRFGTHKLVSRQEGIRAVIAGMREGLPFYYLPDQDYGPRDALFVPFFGIQTATVPGLARIARLVGARVLPCVTRMLAPGEGYTLTIERAWENFPTADTAADTRRMNEYIERKVLEMPEQYLWMHKRFKTRPPGEAHFYPKD